MKVSGRMSTQDDNQNSILKGILQNGSSFNYPAVRFGRVPKREKAKITAAMESSRLKNMENRVMAEMMDDAKIIETIVRAHFDTCDYTADKIKPFIAKAHQDKQYTQCTGMTCPMKGRPEQSFLDTFSERFMNHVRQVCTFAKSIPGFKCLHHDDQVCLLKSCIFEVLLVRLSGLFDNQRLVCLNGDVIKRETISAMPAGNAKFLLDSVFELAQRINRFRLADAEIGLFCSVVIIAADRPGLRNPEIVGQMQSKLKMVLQNILAPQHPDNSSIFSELLTILHDLRTLNTLHTEKFLQQARVTGDQVRDAARESTCPGSRVTMLYGGAEQRDWEVDNQDRDSTGSRSPQSSDSHVTNHSYSYEEMNRRSPIGSVSSSESLGSSETFSKLSVNDLKIHGVGSVLLNALTSPAMTTTTCPINRKRVSETASRATAETERPENAVASKQQAGTECPFKSRKLESPSDSGIDSPKAQGSQSTNTSVCSSPRSSMEDNVKEVETEPEAAASSSSAAVTAKAERPETHGLEEAHPLLKRALQQPPQPFNVGVTGFQDEVYHKKFRHSGRKDSNEPTSTQETGARSPSPVSPVSSGHSILASQLAAPPQHSQPSHSLLASTLSRPVSIPGVSRASEQRNEWLANLILDRQRGGQQPGGQSSQGLLMQCGQPAPAHSNNIPAGPAPGASTRHIPVPVAPTQPSSSSKNTHLKMALAGLTKTPISASTNTQDSTSSSSTSTDTQPLNLSTRTPPPTSANISTEA